MIDTISVVISLAEALYDRTSAYPSAPGGVIFSVVVLCVWHGEGDVAQKFLYARFVLSTCLPPKAQFHSSQSPGAAFQTIYYRRIEQYRMPTHSAQE